MAEKNISLANRAYTIIKENHDTNVKVSDISKIVKENQFWKKLTHNMKKKMKSFSQAFIFIYSMVESLIFKMILILLILVLFIKIYALNKKAFSLFLTVVSTGLAVVSTSFFAI